MKSEPDSETGSRRRAGDFAALTPRIEEAERLLKAIANAHRLAVLCELYRGEACVGELTQALGLSQSSVSQHLARLREDALVKTRRDSQSIYYSLADDRSRKLIEVVYAIFCQAPDARGTRVRKPSV